MIKTLAIFGFVSVSGYVFAAVLAQAAHTDILDIYSIGIFGGVVIAAMRLQRIEDRINNLPCRPNGNSQCNNPKTTTTTTTTKTQEEL